MQVCGRTRETEGADSHQVPEGTVLGGSPGELHQSVDGGGGERPGHKSQRGHPVHHPEPVTPVHHRYHIGGYLYCRTCVRSRTTGLISAGCSGEYVA